MMKKHGEVKLKKKLMWHIGNADSLAFAQEQQTSTA